MRSSLRSVRWTRRSIASIMRRGERGGCRGKTLTWRREHGVDDAATKSKDTGHMGTWTNEEAFSPGGFGGGRDPADALTSDFCPANVEESMWGSFQLYVLKLCLFLDWAWPLLVRSFPRCGKPRLLSSGGAQASVAAASLAAQHRLRAWAPAIARLLASTAETAFVAHRQIAPKHVKSSQTRDQTHVKYIVRKILNHWATRSPVWGF